MDVLAQLFNVTTPEELTARWMRGKQWKDQAAAAVGSVLRNTQEYWRQIKISLIWKSTYRELELQDTKNQMVFRIICFVFVLS